LPGQIGFHGRIGSVSDPGPNLHDLVGGEAFFVELVDRFYRGVAADPLLRPLYPDDLTAAKHHLVLFLVQYWGGPGTYSEQRGHPRLRMRHAPFVIAEAERDAWLRHMAAAVEAALAEREVDPQVEGQLREYFTRAADFMVNAR
jgi:hemoglobin